MWDSHVSYRSFLCDSLVQVSAAHATQQHTYRSLDLDRPDGPRRILTEISGDSLRAQSYRTVHVSGLLGASCLSSRHDGFVLVLSPNRGVGLLSNKAFFLLHVL